MDRRFSRAFVERIVAGGAVAALLSVSAYGEQTAPRAPVVQVQSSGFGSPPPVPDPSGVSQTNDQGESSTDGQDEFRENTITACQDITARGNYSLAGNLVGTDVNTACLRVHDTQHVQIDCKFNSIRGGIGIQAPAISLVNVQRFSITRCTLQADAGAPQADAGNVLMAINSSDGDIVGNTIGNLTDQKLFLVTFDSVHNTRLVHNTINASFQQFYSSSNLLRSNRVTCSVWTNNLGCAGVLVSDFGSENTFERNQIDGKGSSSTGQNGADDGILIQDESEDVVSNNTIRNTWDAGIETAGNITNLQISSNAISSVGQAGIGGWFWNSWSHVTVTKNTVSDAPFLFVLYRIGGLRPQNWDFHGAPADTAVYFQGNVFARNEFVASSFPASNAAYIPIYNDLGYDGGTILPGERAAQRSDFQLNDNTFTRNDFGHFTDAPNFTGPFTAGEILDGGGNTCSSPGPDYPLVCK